jgi:hypothetical protein
VIEVTETLRWALIIFTIGVGPEHQETMTFAAPSFYATYASCVIEGDRILSLAEPVEGTHVHFACVPRAAILQPAG